MKLLFIALIVQFKGFTRRGLLQPRVPLLCSSRASRSVSCSSSLVSPFCHFAPIPNQSSHGVNGCLADGTPRHLSLQRLGTRLHRWHFTCKWQPLDYFCTRLGIFNLFLYPMIEKWFLPPQYLLISLIFFTNCNNHAIGISASPLNPRLLHCDIELGRRLGVMAEVKGPLPFLRPSNLYTMD